MIGKVIMTRDGGYDPDREEVTYWPRVSEIPPDRKKSKIHYAELDSSPRTFCGIPTENMSQRCLDEVTLSEAKEQKDSCRRCISAMV